MSKPAPYDGYAQAFPEEPDASLVDVLAENGTDAPCRARARVLDPEWLAAMKALATQPKPTAARRVARIELAEHMLVDIGFRPKRVRGELTRLLGISHQQAQPIVNEARERLRLATAESTEDRKARIDGQAQAAWRAAMDHHKPITVGDGVGLSHVELWPEPNEAAALKALEFQARLHGMLEPQKIDITVGGSVDVQVMAAMQRAYGMLPSVEVVEAGEGGKALPEDAGDGE